jgi:hypothetical protein
VDDDEDGAEGGAEVADEELNDLVVVLGGQRRLVTAAVEQRQPYDCVTDRLAAGAH